MIESHLSRPPIWQKMRTCVPAQSIGYVACSLCGNDGLHAGKCDHALRMGCVLTEKIKIARLLCYMQALELIPGYSDLQKKWLGLFGNPYLVKSFFNCV